MGLCLYMAKLTFLWYDYFVENQTPLQRSGMGAIPKKLGLFVESLNPQETKPLSIFSSLNQLWAIRGSKSNWELPFDM